MYTVEKQQLFHCTDCFYHLYYSEFVFYWLSLSMFLWFSQFLCENDHHLTFLEQVFMQFVWMPFLLVSRLFQSTTWNLSVVDIKDLKTNTVYVADIVIIIGGTDVDDCATVVASGLRLG